MVSAFLSACLDEAAPWYFVFVLAFVYISSVFVCCASSDVEMRFLTQDGDGMIVSSFFFFFFWLAWLSYVFR